VQLACTQAEVTAPPVRSMCRRSRSTSSRRVSIGPAAKDEVSREMIGAPTARALSTRRPITSGQFGANDAAMISLLGLVTVAEFGNRD